MQARMHTPADQHIKNIKANIRIRNVNKQAYPQAFKNACLFKEQAYKKACK